MLTLDKMRELGIDPAEGLARCMNMEEFFFKMVKMGAANEYFDALEASLAAGDLKAAFEQAHALKGVMGNLSLQPIYEPLAEMTEMLRTGQQADYVALYRPIKAKRDELLALCGD